MHRDYSSGTTYNVDFFIGKEVEHTPAYGMNTLFVVGVQSFDAIQRILDDRNALLDSSKHEIGRAHV